MAHRWTVPVFSALVALLALALVVPGASVSGAIPDRGGKYSACLTKKTGAIKVIDYPRARCSAGQRLIQWNAQGPQGAQGIQGAQGPAGPAGVTRITVTTNTRGTSPIGANADFQTAATCPAGRVIGGGFGQFGNELVITQSRPDPLDPTKGWRIYGKNSASYDITNGGTVYAICLTSEPSTVVARLSPAAKKAIERADKNSRPERH